MRVFSGLGFLVGIFGLLLSSLVLAQNNTPENWKCFNRVGGDWVFGIAPYGCDARTFGSDSRAFTNYTPVIYQQAQSASMERSRYMQELHSLLRDTAIYFIRSRKSSVSQTEVDMFVSATLAIAHQESFWSHYRVATQDNRLKMMRGDFGHGHGLMQLDDRWHYLAANQGKGWELVSNILYSLDEYYAAWQRAPSSSCVSSASNWRSRTRAAYSAYNGGPSQICRWTNPNHTWARNDKGFLQKYDGRAWLAYVGDTSAASTINVKCLAEGGSFCPPNAGGDWLQKLMLISDGSACVFDGEGLHCIEDMRHSACLVSVGDFDSTQLVRVDSSAIDGIANTRYDPHTLCRNNIAGLMPVTSSLRTLTKNTLRSTPGGDFIREVPAGTVLQVLDFSVTNNRALNRFYRVKFQGAVGYIWGGNAQDHANWLQSTTSKASEASEPTFGDWVRVVPNLNFRQTPGGTLLATIPQGTEVLVKGVVGQDTNNALFLHTEYNGKDGYIYAGSLYPQSSSAAWVQRTSTNKQAIAAYCPTGTTFDSVSLFCRDAVDVYGNFTDAMREKCQQWGGGAACTDRVPVSIAERNENLLRWSIPFFTALRGHGVCPAGTTTVAAFGDHCVQSDGSGAAKDVYGPFSTPLVRKCLQLGGGTACYTNRWAASFYRSIINSAD